VEYSEKKKKRKLEPTAALEQMQSFCAYQERCHKEVRTRLIDYQVYGDDLEDIIAELISEGFLNEERFARSYCRGKIRMKKWGRIKIKRELKFKQISEYCIKKGMTEIDEEEYHETLLQVLEKKNRLLREPDDYKRRQKLTTYAAGRGFEYDVIKNVLMDLGLIN